MLLQILWEVAVKKQQMHKYSSRLFNQVSEHQKYITETFLKYFKVIIYILISGYYNCWKVVIMELIMSDYSEITIISVHTLWQFLDKCLFGGSQIFVTEQILLYLIVCVGDWFQESPWMLRCLGTQVPGIT